MKRVNNIYNEIVDIKVIKEVYRESIRKNTKNKHKLEVFENNYITNIINVKNILEQRDYHPGKYNIFLIREPKLRLIMSQNIIDKLINHTVSKYFLVNVLDKTLINENVATRMNKGTHYGIKILKKYLNEIKDRDFYILKFDVSKYFFSLDHEIIKDLLRKKIKDPDALKILDKIIDSTDELYINEEIKRIKNREIEKINKSNIINKAERINEINALPFYKKGKGLPIGSMCSQILAVLYANEIDRFIKENLKIKYYIRYMDDGLLMHENKEYLVYCLKEITEMFEKYKLQLNHKTQIMNIKNGFDFLGFRYYIKNGKVIMKVKNQTKRRFKRKLKNMYKLKEEKRITNKQLIQVRNSYTGHLGHGNTQKLIKQTITKKEELNFIKVIYKDGDIIHINLF